MGRVDDEAEVAADLRDRCLQHPQIEGKRPATDVAHEVLMRLVVSQVIDRWSVTQVAVGQYSRLLEHVECAVHRGLIGGARQPFGDRGCGQVVAVVSGHDLTHRPPRMRHADPGGP